MGKITSLQAGKSRNKRVNLFLDDKFALSLEAEMAVTQGLRVGQDLSEDQLGELQNADKLQSCFNSATRLVSYRPRSEAELRERLQRRGFDSDSIDAALNKLRKYALVDDMAFAEFWLDNRTSFSPRSKWLTKQELRRKGVNNEIIEQTVAASDDADNAYRAAVSKIRSLPLSDHQVFRHRLGDFLRRRGFSYEIINHVAEQLWQEHGGDPG